MTEDRSSDLLGQLPRSRPHRRSTKRAARPPAASTPSPKAKATRTATGAKRSGAKAPAKRSARTKPASAKRLPQPAQPRGVPAAPRRRRPAPAEQQPVTPILRTAVQAAAELAEIGVSLGVRGLRRAIARLPRA